MSFRHGVEVGLQRAYAALLVLFGAGWTALVVQALSGSGPIGGFPLSTAAAVAFVLTSAALTVRGGLTRLGPVDVAAVVLSAAAVQVAFLVELPPDLVIGYRTQPSVAALVPLLTVVSRRSAVPGTLGVAALQIATSLPADGAIAALLGVWPLVVAGSIAAGMAPALRVAGARADDAARTERDARIAADSADAEREASAEFARVLHDDVSAALRAAATPSVGSVERGSEARRALVALDGAVSLPPEPGEVDLREVLALLGATACRMDLPDERVAVPAAVADALRGAAREALRNVHRHASASDVCLRLECDPHVRVTVSDDGVGFDLSARPASPGIAGSIVGRMASVDGTGTVTSAIGAGTTVTLVWSGGEPTSSLSSTRAAPTGRVELLAAATGDVRRPLFAVTVGYLAVMALVAVVQPGQVPHARWFLAWYAVVCALTLLLIVRARTGVGPFLSAATAVFAVTGAVASVAVVPVGDLLTFASWPIGAVTPLLTVLVVVRPSREALLAMIVEQTGIVVILLAGPMTGTSFLDVVFFALPLLVAPALGTLMGLLLGRTIRRLGRATIEANVRRAEVEARAAGDRARGIVRDRRMAALHEQVRPFLDAVATGIDDAATRRATALRLDMTIRDELHMPDVLDRELRTAVDAMRGVGCRVVFQPFAGTRFDRQRVVALLRPVLDGSPPEEIVLGLYSDGGTITASLVVVPGRELVPPSGAPVTVRESTPEYAWLEVDVS